MSKMVGVLLLVLAGVFSAAEAQAYDHAAYEQKLAEQIAAIDAEAARLFADANAAGDREDWDAAAALYQQVRERAPKFSAATRRLCSTEVRRGKREQAIALCREALATERLIENEIALAEALVTVPRGTAIPPKDVTEALNLAGRAADTEGADDPYSALVLCQAAIPAQSLDRLRDCSKKLQRVAPELAPTHLYSSLVSASDGNFDEAFASLERARELGLPVELYESMREKFEAGMPLHERYGPGVLRGLAGWVLGFVLLLGLGALLSKLTLQTASRVPKRADGHATGADRWLRRIYRLVLWASCAYYYLSLPIVVVLVLVAGGGVIYGFLALGRIPVQILVIVAVVTLVSVWSVLKSVFARRRASEPGEPLDLNEHPRLRAVLEEAAARVGTRPVDKVYLTPSTDVAVFERGGLWRQLSGRTERCLVLGAGVLDGFEVGAFKAVLAHEYGHFHNEDTAGGGFALAVRRSILALAVSLAQGGAAAWYNPAWLFVSWFHRLFLRISQGASRLQEVLADRWAAFAYGADAFASGLRHVVERSIRFEVHLQCALDEVIQEKRALANLYRYRVRGKSPEASEIESAIEEALHAEPSPYDSHPSPANRIAWVKALPRLDIARSAEDGREVWELFAGRAQIEKRMTDKIRVAVELNHGVVIPASAPKSSESNEEPEQEDAAPAA